MLVKERTSGGDERRIVTGMVVSPGVCGKVAAQWGKGDLFRSPWANLVADWCVAYYLQYGTAPGINITGIYEAWASTTRDRDTVELVHTFLGGLSSEYERAGEINAEFVVDLAGTHFNRVRLERLAEAIRGDLDTGNMDAAQQRVVKWGQVELGGGVGVNLLHDEGAVDAAFAAKQEPLIVYPDALGKFFDDALERDAFIAFLGPEKRGKTWWLLDVAWRAMCQRRRVAFFEVGDMSQNQIMRRFAVRAARHPLRACTVKVPTSLEYNDDLGRADPVHVERDYDRGLDPATAKAAFQKLATSTVRSTEPYFKLSCHPNSSISVAGVQGVLDGWGRDGWTPDVVVIDYADILAPISGGSEDTRDQINQTWKQLRSMSQRLHCLVVTATQANAGSYAAETVTRQNFSEDKRKLAHVTGMVGLSATEAEKQVGVMRLNWVALREGEYSESRCVHVATCLALGNPAVKSCFGGNGHE